MDRAAISRTGVATAACVGLVALATWQRSSLRLAAVAAWLTALILLWAASPVAPTSAPPVERRPICPPRSPTAERLALLAVLVVAAAFRFVLLAQVPPFIANDESMLLFETSWRPDRTDLYGASLLQSWPWGWFPFCLVRLRSSEPPVPRLETRGPC